MEVCEFVNYSIGKKLKEKGYPHEYNRFGYRPIYSDECTIRYLWDTGAYDEEYYGEHIPCPTINQVLKWLRVDRCFHVSPDLVSDYSVDADGNICEEWTYWSYSIHHIIDGVLYRDYNQFDHIEYQSWEEAALAGIKYVLDNLI